MSVRIIVGDALEQLRLLPDESVHCVVTSPPYWGLRDYGIAGQIGLEPDFRLYIDRIVDVFREVRRVLRPDGTLWLNLGDCYATGAGFVGDRPGGGAQGDRWAGYPGSRGFRGQHLPHQSGKAAPRISSMGPMTQPNRMPQPGLKPKDLMMMPARVALALQADGWWLRRDIIWHKPNPMPESVIDRCTTSHEYLFHLTKSERYFYDATAIMEPCESGPSDIKKMTEGLDRIGGKHKTLDDPLARASAATNMGRKRSVGSPEGRNKRSIWTISTEPNPFAHFAMMPTGLAQPCILAGCPKGGTVIDPFGGAGTTALVADRLGRDAILIELNPEYAEMARRRIERDAGMFAKVAAE